MAEESPPHPVAVGEERHGGREGWLEAKVVRSRRAPLLIVLAVVAAGVIDGVARQVSPTPTPTARTQARNAAQRRLGS